MSDTLGVRTYGQYCPIARASEILAERWTPLIIRNLLNGSTTFTQIAADAPGISRSLLTARLRDLAKAGVVQITPNPNGNGSVYHLTEAGKDLLPVIVAIGTWGERWLDLNPEHVDPGVVLNSWCKWYLAKENLPERRVVVRFDFPDQPTKTNQAWLIFDGENAEVCRTDPGFDEDLVVTAESKALAEWHLGRIEWTDAVRSERIQVSGPQRLARVLPTWNRRSAWAHIDGIRQPQPSNISKDRTTERQPP